MSRRQKELDSMVKNIMDQRKAEDENFRNKYGIFTTKPNKDIKTMSKELIHKEVEAVIKEHNDSSRNPVECH